MSKTSKAKKKAVQELKTGTYVYSAFKPRDEFQKKAVDVILNNPVSFIYGVAGTGKTTVAVGCALRLLMTDMIDTIVVTRPYVTAGEKLGYLPGNIEEKFDPFIMPIKMILEKLVGKSTAGRYFASNKIMMLPLAYMRGMTFEKSFVIMDESQNSTCEQMHLILTRLGKDSKLCITGDEFQTDIEKGSKNGLTDAINRLRGINGIGQFEFPPESCQRHALVSEIDSRYKINLKKN
jgi:phosphate starvation-inducible protein PhoH and related proteins